METHVPEGQLICFDDAEPSKAASRLPFDDCPIAGRVSIDNNPFDRVLKQSQASLDIFNLSTLASQQKTDNFKIPAMPSARLSTKKLPTLDETMEDLNAVKPNWISDSFDQTFDFDSDLKEMKIPFLEELKVPSPPQTPTKTQIVEDFEKLKDKIRNSPPKEVTPIISDLKNLIEQCTNEERRSEANILLDRLNHVLEKEESKSPLVEELSNVLDGLKLAETAKAPVIVILPQPATTKPIAKATAIAVPMPRPIQRQSSFVREKDEPKKATPPMPLRRSASFTYRTPKKVDTPRRSIVQSIKRPATVTHPIVAPPPPVIPKREFGRMPTIAKKASTGPMKATLPVPRGVTVRTTPSVSVPPPAPSSSRSATPTMSRPSSVYATTPRRPETPLTRRSSFNRDKTPVPAGATASAASTKQVIRRPSISFRSKENRVPK